MREKILEKCCVREFGNRKLKINVKSEINYLSNGRYSLRRLEPFYISSKGRFQVLFHKPMTTKDD